MLRLYDFPSSGNCYKIRLLLTQLGIPFERVEVNIFQRESRTPEFIGKNLNGRVPVLGNQTRQISFRIKRDPFLSK